MADVAKIAEYLQDTEIAILKALLDKKEVDTTELSSELNENQSVIARATLWLSNKQLINTKETPSKIAKLTDLAKEYNSDFLPERRFLTAAKKPAMLPEIKDAAKLNDNEVKFSLGYLKKKGWIEFEKGKVQLTKEASDDETPEETLIEKLFREEGLELDKLSSTEKDTLQLLIKRNLATIEEKTLREYSITDLGKKVIKNAGDVKRIGVLTAKMIKSREWEKGKFRRYDVEAPVPRMFAGKKQAYRAFLDEVKEELVSLGFEQMEGPLVDNCLYNCDALFMPQDHPARGIHDMYFVKDAKPADLTKERELLSNVGKMHEFGGSGSKGWGIKFSEKQSAKQVLRSQTTGVSARTLLSADLKIPGKYYSIGRVYRPEKLDSTHLTEFNQVEGIVVGKDVNFRNMLWLLGEFAKKVTGADEVKFSSVAYFPFTEPSVSGYIKLGNEWVEIFGAGMFRPEMLEPLGIKENVLAWGIGIGRLFMVKEQLKDIRQLFSYDLDYLREAKL